MIIKENGVILPLRIIIDPEFILKNLSFHHHQYRGGQCYSVGWLYAWWLENRQSVAFLNENARRVLEDSEDIIMSLLSPLQIIDS